MGIFEDGVKTRSKLTKFVSLVIFSPNDELFLQVLLCKILSVNTSQSLAQHSSVLGHKLSEKLLKLSTDIKSRNSDLRSDNKKCSLVEYYRLDPFNVPSVAGL